MSLCTPAKIHQGKNLPIQCDIAFICLCPMPEIFKEYQDCRIRRYKERYFLQLHPKHVAFCSYKGKKFVVCAEVYGGPVTVSIVEELHYYGVSTIVGIGFVGSLSIKFSIGSNLNVNKALSESGTTPHYIKDAFKSDWVSSDWDFSLLDPITKLESVECWTTNAIYREYLSDVNKFRELGCDVVNMDTSHLFASCRLLNMFYGYVCTVSDVLNEEWENHLSNAVNTNESKGESIVLTQQRKLISSILENINVITTAKDQQDQLRLSYIRNSVIAFFIEKNICKSHDINHIDRCSDMLNKVLINDPSLSQQIKFSLHVAVLLHDVDDGKFVTNENYDNARNILRLHNVCRELEDQIIEIISYISSSKNGDSIPEKAEDKEYLLYPRFVDRLDAIGVHGVIRCYQFTKTKSNPLFLESTLIPSEHSDKEYEGSL